MRAHSALLREGGVYCLLADRPTRYDGRAVCYPWYVPKAVLRGSCCLPKNIGLVQAAGYMYMYTQMVDDGFRWQCSRIGPVSPKWLTVHTTSSPRLNSHTFPRKSELYPRCPGRQLYRRLMTINWPSSRLRIKWLTVRADF